MYFHGSNVLDNSKWSPSNVIESPRRGQKGLSSMFKSNSMCQIYNMLDAFRLLLEADQFSTSEHVSVVVTSWVTLLTAPWLKYFLLLHPEVHFATSDGFK